MRDLAAGRATRRDLVARQDLWFKTPFESRSKATFVFASEGGKTKVTWLLDGGDGLQTKMMNVFMDMDEAVGKDFENGLRFLDEEAQKAKAVAATAEAAEETTE